MLVVGAIKARVAQMNVIKGEIKMAGLGIGITLLGYGIKVELSRAGIVNVPKIFPLVVRDEG